MKARWKTEESASRNLTASSKQRNASFESGPASSLELSDCNLPSLDTLPGQAKRVFSPQQSHLNPTIVRQSSNGEDVVIAYTHETVRFPMGQRLLVAKRADENSFRARYAYHHPSADPLDIQIVEDRLIIAALEEPHSADGRLVHRTRVVGFPLGAPDQPAELFRGEWRPWTATAACALAPKADYAAIATDHHIAVARLALGAPGKATQCGEFFFKERVHALRFLDRGKRLAIVLQETSFSENASLLIATLPGDYPSRGKGICRLLCDEAVQRIAVNGAGDMLAVASKTMLRIYKTAHRGNEYTISLQGFAPLRERTRVTALAFDDIHHCVCLGRHDGALVYLAFEQLQEGRPVEVRRFQLYEPIEAISCENNRALVSVKSGLRQIRIEGFARKSFSGSAHLKSELAHHQ